MKSIYTSAIILTSALVTTSWAASGQYAFDTNRANQQYVSAKQDATEQPVSQKQWKKPQLHGRGGDQMALIVMNGKPTPDANNPKQFPGMDWKGKSKTAPKQFPGMDWKSKSKTTPVKKRPPRGTRTLPGMTWKPKSAN